MPPNKQWSCECADCRYSFSSSTSQGGKSCPRVKYNCFCASCGKNWGGEWTTSSSPPSHPSNNCTSPGGTYTKTECPGTIGCTLA